MELKYVVVVEQSAAEKSFDKIAKKSKETSTQVIRDFEKVAAKQKQLQLEINKGELGNGNTGSAINPQNAARAAAANSAYASSSQRASEAIKQQAAATTQVTVAQTAQAKSIEQLSIKVAAYQNVVRSSNDPAIISRYNGKIQETSKEITRLSNLGKSGFDKFGAAVKTSSGFTGKMMTGLKSVAAFLPGIGVASIIAFAAEPIIKYIAQLGIFGDKVTQIAKNLEAYNEVNRNAHSEAGTQIATLKVLYAAATDVTLSIKKRTEASKELQKVFPDAFHGSKTQAILNGAESDSFENLTVSILKAARAKAAKTKLDEIEAKRLGISFQKEKIRNANANENKREVDVTLTDETGFLQQKFSAEDQKKINNRRAEQAIKLQEDQDKILKAQSDFLIKYVGNEELAKTVIDRKVDKPSVPKANPELAAQKALQERLDDLHDQATIKQLSDDDAEVESVRIKYAEMRQEVDEYYKKYKKLKVDASNLDKDEQAEINVILKKRADEQAKIDKEKFDELLQQHQTYSQKREKIIKDSEDTAAKFREQGFYDNANQVEANAQDEIKALVQQQAEKLKEYQELFNKVGELSKKQTADAIAEFRKQALAAGLPVDAIDKLIAKFNELDSKEKSKARSQELSQIVEELSRVATQFENINGSISGIAGILLSSAKSYLQITKGLEDFNKKGASPEAKIGAGVGMVGAALAVVNTIFGYFKGLKKAKEEAKKALSEFQATATKGEQEYQSLLRKRDLDQIARGKNTYQAIVSQLDLLMAQSPKIQAAYDKVYQALQGQSSVSALGSKNGTLLRKAKTWDIMASLAGADYSKLEHLYSQGKLKDTAKSDFEALRALKEELEAAGLQVEELQSQLKELLTGTSTSGLASSLAELFENGKFAAKDFGKSFEQIMATAIKNSFRLKVMEDSLSPLYEEFSKLFVNGTPTESQLDDLRKKYEAIGLQLGQQFKDLEKITGRNLSSGSDKGGSSLRGIGEQITENTGTALLGAFNGLRIIAAQHLKVAEGAHLTNQQCLSIANQTLNTAIQIERNTLRIAQTGDNFLPFLKNISDNTKDTLSVQLRAGGKFGY